MHESPQHSDEIISKEAVLWAYRMFLGRDPDRLGLIDQHLSAHKSMRDLRKFFSQHREFLEFSRQVHSSSEKYALQPFLVDWLLEDASLAQRIIPTLAVPNSQLCTHNQFLEPVYRKWCARIKLNFKLHRKQWEFVYILQSLEHFGALRAGAKGLGFGTGREPLPSYMASRGISVLATDAPPEINQGWDSTNEYTTELEVLWKADIVDKGEFTKFVKFEPADMNNIPESYKGYDFCWSACCFEHLGSIEHGLRFVENSLKTLKPGGVAVHTSEFNLSSNDQTLDSGATVIFRKRDMDELCKRLTASGYNVRPFTFYPGTAPADTHVDLPPYKNLPHVKLEIDKYVVTSIGIIVSKPLDYVESK